MSTFLPVDAWDDLANEITALLRRKQDDYGSDNILLTGHIGLAMRLTDKASRLLNLTRKDGNTQPNFESIRDTYLDVAGYGIIGAMLTDGTFPPENRETE